MSSSPTNGDTAPLSPDDAFAVLGNATRMRILRTLADADAPLSFSELRERSGLPDSGQFNYHLNKLVGHFVTNPDGRYELRSAGLRVIEAVLSGAITDTSELPPTRTEVPCHHCGAAITMSFRQDWVAKSCPNCAGTYGQAASSSRSLPEGQLEHGYLGGHMFPPAGIQDRSPSDIVRASRTWGVLEKLAIASGLCPRCAAPIETTTTVCEDHEARNGLCDRCGSLHAVQFRGTCTNCPHVQEGVLVNRLFEDTEFLAFLTTRGLNPIRSPPEFIRVLQTCEEEVLSTDPFEARFTFTIDGDSITLTVDDALMVVDVTERPAAETG